MEKTAAFTEGEDVDALNLVELLLFDGITDEHARIEEEQTGHIRRNREDKLGLFVDGAVKVFVVLQTFELIEDTVEAIGCLLRCFSHHLLDIIDKDLRFVGLLAIVVERLAELFGVDDGIEEDASRQSNRTFAEERSLVQVLGILCQEQNVTRATTDVDAEEKLVGTEAKLSREGETAHGLRFSGQRFGQFWTTAHNGSDFAEFFVDIGQLIAICLHHRSGITPNDLFGFQTFGVEISAGLQPEALEEGALFLQTFVVIEPLHVVV